MDTFDMTPSGGDDKPRTMTSLEIAEITGKRHDNVRRDTRNMLVELVGEGGLLSFEDTHHNPQNGQQYPIYRLPRRECLILVSGYSVELRAKIIDRWEQLERGIVPQRSLTTAESFLALAQITVDLERQQKEQAVAIRSITAAVQELKDSASVLPSCPSNAESITHIKTRIGKATGLSDRIVDFVMRDGPYAPRPFATVRNSHSDAENSSYVVWNKKDVNAVFKRFVGECEAVTASFCTHPFVDGRFRTTLTTGAI